MPAFVPTPLMPYETTIRALYKGYHPPIMEPKAVEQCVAKPAIDITLKDLRKAGFKTKAQQTFQLKKRMDARLTAMLAWHDTHPESEGKQVPLNEYFEGFWGSQGLYQWAIWHMELATLLFIGGLDNDDENGFMYAHFYDPTKPLPAMVAASAKKPKA